MIEIWDYFMRRKSLLLLVLAVFFVSSLLSVGALRSNTFEPTSTYISVQEWGTNEDVTPDIESTQNNITGGNQSSDIEDIEIPKTGGEVIFTPFVAVMNPNEVTQILPPLETVMEETGTTSEADESATQPYQIVDQPENIVNSTSATKTTYRKPRHSLFYNLFLAVMGMLILVLGGYLTYWHFRR